MDLMGPGFPSGSFAVAHSRYLDPTDEEDEEEEEEMSDKKRRIHAECELAYLLTDMREMAWIYAGIANQNEYNTFSRGYAEGKSLALCEYANKLEKIMVEGDML